MDSMMDLWREIPHELNPASSCSVLKTPSSSHNMLSSGLDWTVFKTPCDRSEDMEDSGYSTCHSSSSIKSLTITEFYFKTPCCPPILKPSRCQRIIPRIPPGYKSKDGLKYLDIVSSLNQIDVLDQLLTLLSPDDLVRCSFVSKEWNSIIKDNRVSRRKRVTFFSSRTKENKENLIRAGELTTEKSQKRLRPSAFSTPLATISSSRQLNFSTPSQSPSSPTKIAKVDRYDLYQKTGSALKSGETQMGCPRCRLPARRDNDINVGQCFNTRCRFQFCLSCLGEQHIDSACLLLRSPEKTGRFRTLTKKGYKRNMRRL